MSRVAWAAGVAQAVCASPSTHAQLWRPTELPRVAGGERPQADFAFPNSSLSSRAFANSSAKRCNFLGSFSTEASAAISCQLRLDFWKLGKAMRSLPLQSGRYVPGILPQLSRCSKAVTIPSSVKTELYNSLEKARRLAEAWKSQAISLRASEPLDR